MTTASFPKFQSSSNVTTPTLSATGRNVPGVHFFMDFSNIGIEAQKLSIEHGDGFMSPWKVRLHAANWRQFAAAGRPWRSGFAAAGFRGPTENFRALKNTWEQVEIKLKCLERGCSSSREQGVDDTIQNRMRALSRPCYRGNVVVLATGDGNGAESGDGFVPVLEQLHEMGLQIEVLSWEHSLNRHLRSWAESRGKLVLLDEHYQVLTFVDGGRSASPFRRR